mgnify:CR=1 FL=1
MRKEEKNQHVFKNINTHHKKLIIKKKTKKVDHINKRQIDRIRLQQIEQTIHSSGGILGFVAAAVVVITLGSGGELDALSK